jgi:hypothetical protein
MLGRGAHQLCQIQQKFESFRPVAALPLAEADAARLIRLSRSPPPPPWTRFQPCQFSGNPMKFLESGLSTIPFIAHSNAFGLKFELQRSDLIVDRRDQPFNRNLFACQALARHCRISALIH